MTDSGHPRILIAGIGNIFQGDDAFGSEVARRLALRPVPECVRVVDFGIRGLDLAYALLEGYDVVILVDTISQGGTPAPSPGTLYVIEPEVTSGPAVTPADLMVQAHGMDPAKALCLVAAMGGGPRRVMLVGCEPTPAAMGSEEAVVVDMSEPVQAAIGPAIELIESLVGRIIAGVDEHAAV